MPPKTTTRNPKTDSAESNAELVEQFNARCRQADTQLELQVRALRSLLSPSEVRAFDSLECAWSSYRDLQAVFARARVAPGSAAGLASASVYLEETERWTAIVAKYLAELESC